MIKNILIYYYYYFCINPSILLKIIKKLVNLIFFFIKKTFKKHLKQKTTSLPKTQLRFVASEIRKRRKMSLKTRQGIACCNLIWSPWTVKIRTPLSYLCSQNTCALDEQVMDRWRRKTNRREKKSFGKIENM